MQLPCGPAMPASLAGTGSGHLAGVTPVLSIALVLSRDGAARALKTLGNLRDRVLLVQQGSDGHAFFRLKLLIAFGWGVVHGRTLLD